MQSQSKNVQQNLNMLSKTALNLIRIYKWEAGVKLPSNSILFRTLINLCDLFVVLVKN